MHLHDTIRTTLQSLNDQLIDLSDALAARQVGPGLDEAISDWVATRALVDELKMTKSILDTLVTDLTDNSIPELLEEEGLTSVKHRLGTVTIAHHTKASIKKDRKPEAYAWLRSNELGGVIIQTVNAQTLAATAKDLLSVGSELPSAHFDVSFRRYAKFTEA